jgi:hypothetical protein
MRTIRLIGMLFVVCLSVGCAARVKNVTNLPPGVTQVEAQNWDKAVQDLSQVAAVTSAARQAIITAHVAGLIKDGPGYVSALTAVGKIDELQLSASAVLKQAPSHFSDTTKGQIADYMNQISAQILILNQSGVTGIKNPNSQQTIGDLITQITTLTALILTL